MEYSVEVNETFKFTADNLSGTQNLTLIGAQLGPLDMIRTGDNSFHILVDGKSFAAELTEISVDRKDLMICVNGNNYKVKLKNSNDVLLSKIGLDNVSTAKVQSLKAPMPGLVLKVSVKEGDIVDKGKPLLILEAMKMENSIRASETVKVKQILIREGDKVEKSQMLMLFDLA